jgi:hypothetical protein
MRTLRDVPLTKGLALAVALFYSDVARQPANTVCVDSPIVAEKSTNHL